MCRRRGAIAASVARAGLQVVRGQNHLQLYQFNTHVAEHYFCDVCGIYTHHRRRHIEQSQRRGSTMPSGRSSSSSTVPQWQVARCWGWTGTPATEVMPIVAPVK
jgi:hypothetical protein